MNKCVFFLEGKSQNYEQIEFFNCKLVTFSMSKADVNEEFHLESKEISGLLILLCRSRTVQSASSSGINRFLARAFQAWLRAMDLFAKSNISFQGATAQITQFPPFWSPD